MNEKYTDFFYQVKLGENLCTKLKQIYYNDMAWASCYRIIAAKLIDLKKKARLFYVDKTEQEMLIELNKLSNESLQAFIEPDEIPP